MGVVFSLRTVHRRKSESRHRDDRIRLLVVTGAAKGCPEPETFFRSPRGAVAEAVGGGPAACPALPRGLRPAPTDAPSCIPALQATPPADRRGWSSRLRDGQGRRNAK